MSESRIINGKEAAEYYSLLTPYADTRIINGEEKVKFFKSLTDVRIINGYDKALYSRVLNTTFTAANARVSYVNGTAFVEASGLDLSAYAGTDLGSTPYLIRLEDASGDVAWGYAGAIGGGEAFSEGELVTNGTMELDANWSNTVNAPATNERSDEQAHAGTYSRKVIHAAAGESGITQTLAALTVGALYKADGWFYKSAGSYAYFMFNASVISTTQTAAAWGQKTGYKVYASGNTAVQGIVDATGTGYFDDFSVQKVTDCAATGLHIMSAKNGIVRGWASIGATFGYNDNLKVSVYRVY